MPKRLTINRCPHHGTWMVAIEDGDGGVRLTPHKCCGEWELAASIAMRGADWRAVAEEAEHAAGEDNE